MANSLESWLKEWQKHSINYPVEDHTDQVVEREQLKIYKEKKKKKEKWGSCNYDLNVKKINQWLLEFHIIAISKESRLMDRQIVDLEIK